jgi:hypothetical protein
LPLHCATFSNCNGIAVSVGASLLAMGVNDNAGIQNERVALEFIASKLAPTMK